MTNENIENFGKVLDRLATERPSRLHHQVVNIAESCCDQLKDLMPGCYVRVIIENADMDAHHSQERVVNGSGVHHSTKEPLSQNEEKDYVLILTDSNND